MATLVTDYGPGVDAETWFKNRFAETGGQVAETLRVPLQNPDFATVARGYGAFGARLERNEDIEGVIADAVRAVTEDRVPAVVHVLADPAKLLPGM